MALGQASAAFSQKPAVFLGGEGTIGNGVGQGHEDDSQEGWNSLGYVIPVYFGSICLQGRPRSHSIASPGQSQRYHSSLIGIFKAGLHAAKDLSTFLRAVDSRVRSHHHEGAHQNQGRSSCKHRDTACKKGNVILHASLNGRRHQAKRILSSFPESQKMWTRQAFRLQIQGLVCIQQLQHGIKFV